ncbi:MAG: hypothetical protein JWN62_1783 [Acidimicrobiales bacterium]|nr:hypothetical protein [Acidimicrobiales bacterium]
MWGAYVERLEAARVTHPANVADVNAKSLRKAAYHTGALEGLHSADRGITLTIVTAELWREALSKEAGDETVHHVDAALDAFDLVLDVATSEQPLSEALIRRLHEIATAAQTTYQVVAEVEGRRVAQDQALLKGAYKTNPNHVQQPDGSFHSYASVAETPHEMHRLVAESRLAEFESAHPAVQAAYVHHALACVHPFADGNGRVARLLASIYLLRAASVPLVIYEDQKASYLTALRAADTDDDGAFVRFVVDRAIDAMGWAADEVSGGDLAIASGRLPSGEHLAARRAAGSRLQAVLQATLGNLTSVLPKWGDESWGVGAGSVEIYPSEIAAPRVPSPGANALTLSLFSPVVGFSSQRSLWVVETLRQDQPFPLGVVSGASVLDVRESDVLPAVTTALQIRLEAFCRSIARRMLDDFERAIAGTQQ